MAMTLQEQIRAWREELLGNLAEMGQFRENGDPRDILPILSGFSARARFMSSKLAPYQSRDSRDFRFEEVHPFIAECEFQRQTWSRIGTLIKDDWDMSKG
jgi:hypothetical protein